MTTALEKFEKKLLEAQKEAKGQDKVLSNLRATVNQTDKEEDEVWAERGKALAEIEARIKALCEERDGLSKPFDEKVKAIKKKHSDAYSRTFTVQAKIRKAHRLARFKQVLELVEKGYVITNYWSDKDYSEEHYIGETGWTNYGEWHYTDIKATERGLYLIGKDSKTWKKVASPDDKWDVTLVNGFDPKEKVSCWDVKTERLEWTCTEHKRGNGQARMKAYHHCPGCSEPVAFQCTGSKTHIEKRPENCRCRIPKPFLKEDQELHEVDITSRDD